MISLNEPWREWERRQRQERIINGVLWTVRAAFFILLGMILQKLIG